MKKRISLILVITLVAFLLDIMLVSCYKEPECPPYYGHLKTDNVAISSSKLYRWAKGDSTGTGPIPAQNNDSIRFDSLALVIDFGKNYVVENSNKQKHYNGFFINTLIASCGHPPPNGTSGHIDSLATLKITSDSAYNASHLAGVVLNDLFDVNTIPYYNYGEIKPLATYTSTFPNKTPIKLFLRLRSNATLSKRHKFKIAVTLKTGDTFSTQLNEIKLY